MSLLALSIISTGCGAISPSNAVIAPVGANIQLSTNYKDSLESKYACSGLMNVLPASQTQANFIDSFSVCPSISSGDYTDILVKGKTSTSQTLCVFPAIEGNSGRYSWIPNSDTNAPTYQCSTTDSTGSAAFSFIPREIPNGFNAALIVELPNVNAMKQCLMGYGACPSYSSGNFR